MPNPAEVRELSTAPSLLRDRQFGRLLAFLVGANIILAGMMMVGARVILTQIAREHAQTVCLLRLLPQDRTDPVVTHCLSDPYDDPISRGAR